MNINTNLLIGTDHGIHRVEGIGKTWEKAHSSLLNHHFTALAQRGNTVLAGTHYGLYKSEDLGKTWREVNQGITHRHIRSVSHHPEDSKLAFAGTEPAAIFISRDGGETWESCPEVSHLRDKYSWSLPYSPNAGCIRGFAFMEERGYAAVEVGGFLRSEDRGATWHLMDPREGESRIASPSPWIHVDVHSVFVHPSSKDQVFAPTGGGLYYSTSGGRSWSQIHNCYCRAVWVDPQRSAHIILGPADGPDRNGCIEESMDAGQTWHKRMDGMGSVWPNHMVEAFVQFDDRLFAALSNGMVVASSLEALEWRPILPELEGVRAVSTLPKGK